MTTVSLLYSHATCLSINESYDQRLLVSYTVFYLAMSNHLLFFQCILPLRLMNHFLFPFFFGTSLPDLLCPPILLLFNPTQHYSVGYYCYLHWYRCCYCCSWYPLILIGNCANSFSCSNWCEYFRRPRYLSSLSSHSSFLLCYTCFHVCCWFRTQACNSKNNEQLIGKKTRQWSTIVLY